MNTTSTSSAANLDGLPSDVRTTVQAAFFGFAAGAILFGITVRQVYQYYTTCGKDPISRKLIIGFVSVLDALHLTFSMYLVYSLIMQLVGFANSALNVLWSLKALGSVQVILIMSVQAFYLSQIWRLSKNILIADGFAIAVKVFVIVISLLALAVGIIFFTQLQRIQVIHSFASGFEYIIFLGFGTTALVDCSIAAAMCLILYKSNAGTANDGYACRSESVLESLIQYFIGSGLLTSFASILCIVLYIAQPDTLLYLGMEFSVTRLYANSLLAISNGRGNLRKKMEEDVSLKIPSGVFFVEPDQMGLMHGLKLEDPFLTPESPEADMKFTVRAAGDSGYGSYGSSGYGSSYTKQGASLSRQSSSRSQTV